MDKDILLKIELPKGWAKTTISEMISADGVFVDGDWIESKDQDPNGEVRLIQLADIGDGDFRDKSSRFLTLKRANEIGCTFLLEGDILIARMPDPIGRACLFPLKGVNKFVTAVDVAIIRTGKDSINNKLLNYFINSPIIRNKIEALQSGTTRKRISRGNLSLIEFPVPPLNEQNRIVEKLDELLSELEKGKEQLQTSLEQLKVYRQSILKHAFEEKLTNENVKDGELPEKWSWKMISEVCKMKAGFFVKASDINESYKDGLFPCYGGNGLRGYVNSCTHEGIFPLVGRQGALCGNVHLVKGKFHATEHAVVVTASEQVEVKWLYYKLISMRLNQYSAGAAQPGLSVNRLLQIKLAIPPKAEQKLIVSELESKISFCNTLEETINRSLTQTNSLKQSLLQKAFEGKLVEQDPTDEPASVLLERLKKEREEFLKAEKERKKTQLKFKSTKQKQISVKLKTDVHNLIES